MAKALADEFNAIDCDQEVLRLSGGTWPTAKNINSKLVNQISDEIMSLNKVLFFTAFFDLEKLKDAKKRGFMVVRLSAPSSVLESRVKERKELEPANSAWKFLESNLKYQTELERTGLVDVHIDSSQTMAETKAELILAAEAP